MTAENQWNYLWSVYCFGQMDLAHIFVKPKSDNPLVAYSQYIGYERRAKYPDFFVTRGIYERAIAEAARRRFNGEAEAEEALRIFWSGYGDALVNRPLRMRFFVVLMSVQRILDAGVDVELEMYRRAVRSVPGSGEVWARYIRLLVSS